jgi:hypothetical protein
VLAGNFGKFKKTVPFKGLKKAELISDLKARKEDISGCKKNLDMKLQEILCGATNVPPLLSENHTVEELNLQA